MDTQPTNTQPQKPTIYLDASALKESSCERRLLYTIFFGYTRGPRARNYQAGYGSAYHKALEYWYSSEEKSEQKAIELALKYYEPFTPFISERVREFRTPGHLTQALQAYFKRYNKDSELLRPISNLMESKFILPWHSSEKFDLVLTGTIDMIADYAGQECYVDHKTTSSYEIESYLEEYKLSVQMLFYSWVIDRLLGRRLPCLINGIFLSKGTQKAKEFDGVKFVRSELMHFTDSQMIQFNAWVEERIRQVISWLEDWFTINPELPGSPTLQTNPNFAACQTRWGACPYFNICKLPPEFQDDMLKGMAVEAYEPLRFGE